MLFFFLLKGSSTHKRLNQRSRQETDRTINNHGDDKDSYEPSSKRKKN